MKRRMQALLMALVLLLSVAFGTATVSAAPAAAWRLEVSDADGIVTVNLFLENGQGVTNGRVGVSYDAQALTLTGAEAAEDVSVVSLNTQNEGQVSLAWVGSTIEDESRLMLELTFAGSAEGTAFTAQTQELWADGTKLEAEDAVLEIPANPFVDIEGHWGEEEILKAYYAGLFKGVDETHFAPDDVMDRAMFVTVLYRMAGEPEVNAEIPFEDVAENVYYSKAVVWAVENGITNGVSTTRFAPHKELSRQELVTMFCRYAKSTGVDVSAQADLSGYPDADQIDSWARESFAWAVEVELILGMKDGTLSPDDAATRAQAAAVFSRWLGL